jgi:hypothetical protein
VQNGMQIEIPAYITFIFPITIAIVLLWVARYLSNRNTDNSTEKQLDRAEKLNEQTGLEAYRIRESATECKTTADSIRKRESEIRESAKQAESRIKESREYNKKAESIIDESLAIIEAAEKEK